MLGVAIFLALGYASVIHGAPCPAYSKHSPQRTLLIGRKVTVEIYHTRTTYKVNRSLSTRCTSTSLCSLGKDFVSANSLTSDTLEAHIISFIASELGINACDVVYMSGFRSSDAISYSYARQSFIISSDTSRTISIPISNAAGNSGAGKVVAFGSSKFVDTSMLLLRVLPSMYHLLSERSKPPSGWTALPTTNKDTNTWFVAQVGAYSEDLISVIDFVADLTYTVIPIQKDAVIEGMETLVDHEDLESSPSGWASSDGATAGNKVVAYKLLTLLTTSESSDGVDTSIYDFTYKYAWTEAVFNFQDDTFDITGTHNANFTTPLDGQSGTCRMYFWTLTNMDESLQNDIITHEFAHGLTNRLTGGGTAPVCKQPKPKSTEINDYVFAAWVFNNGIRTSDPSVNPLRYSSIQDFNEVHDIDEVWANMVHNVYAAFVGAYGWSDVPMTDPSGAEGNIVYYMHLFIDALSLQPCNPALPDARDAWTQADVNRYNGANKCIMI
ncbi:hypothetical protein BDZ89DRAFT_1126462 [Hymenopellis radicata]|nr:hypothetical protein BDZ89DRAFT_1126462 [Hymenopellis radicata]